MTFDLATSALSAEQLIEAVMKIEPTVMTVASALVPGAAPVAMTVQPIIALVIPAIEQALKDVGEGHPGDLLATLTEFLNHISKGRPNSPVLSQPEPEAS
jgi:hypothetical protein